jgi:D-alanyl-D-alanine carboxypeptidase (penicillin-binding protein 5/6)
MGGSQVFLAPGEVLSLDEMMRAVMVASANDAAYAVAEFIAGSREGFVALMNEKAKALNMTDTRFTSMHGLPPSKDQAPDVSSPHDLAALAREIVKQPQILAWSSLKTEPFRGGTLIMRNHNKLLNRFPGMDGLKTGYYREAGYSIVATAKNKGLRMIAVVMGSPTARGRDHVTEEKLKDAFARYEMITVIQKGDVVDREVALTDGEQKTLRPVAASGFSYPVPRDRKAQLTREVALPERLKAEIKEGQRVGELVVRFEDQVVGRIALISPVHIPRLGFFGRLFN